MLQFPYGIADFRRENATWVERMQDAIRQLDEDGGAGDVPT